MTKKQNSNQIPNGGYSLGGYGNITISGTTGLTYATTTPWYVAQPRVKITEDDIKIDGLSLHETLQTLNQRLGVLQVNPELEQEFDELRACADRYRELEKKFLEQKRIWETLKK
jgi:hypothetical protein